jgi:DNA primase
MYFCDLLKQVYYSMLTDQTYSLNEADLLKIASKYILLVESRRNLKGRCPFHADQGTSFMLSPEKNIFKCFGCGKDGGPIEFIMYMEGKTREEAIQQLAKFGN